MPAKAIHKQALVQTAMRLFRRQGYASSGLNQILSESQAPKGSLYYYFPGGKEELAVAAVELAGEMIADMLRQLAAQKRTLHTFVKGYAATMAGWMEESGFRSGCPIATTMLEAAPDSPALTAAGRQAMAGWQDIIAEVMLREGYSQTDACIAARNLLASMQGALILARVWCNAEPIYDIARPFRT